jgi:hypothetical protein
MLRPRVTYWLVSQSRVSTGCWPANVNGGRARQSPQSRMESGLPAVWVLQ